MASLVKKVDGLVEKNSGQQLKSFVVLLTDDPDEAEEQLVAFAKKNGISNVPMTFYEGLAGPPNYKIGKDAAVTVLLWKNLTVKVNNAFASGGLNEKASQKVLASVDKILD